MKTKASIVIPLLLALMKFSYGQSLKKVVGPSPEISSLFRFLDHPVDPSTGVPQISVPLYEIRAGNLNWPINISYHAGGRRAMDESWGGWFGMVAKRWGSNFQNDLWKT